MKPEIKKISTFSELTIITADNGYIIKTDRYGETNNLKVAKDLNEVKQLLKKYLKPINQ